jgi:hypothetical protein
MAKKESAIILVGSNKLLFYSKKANNTWQLNLPSEVISNLEVVSRERLEYFVDRLFQMPNLKGKEFEVTLIFSQNTTFEKELTSTNSKAEFEETQKFIDMVPFEDVLSNEYRVNKKTRVVAVNKVLYSVLKQVLEKNKSKISLVLPMTILAVTNSELTSRISFPYIESRLESFKQYSLLDLEESGLGGEVPNSIGIKKKDVRLYVLILVMIALFLILIFLFYTTFLAAPKHSKHVIPTPVKTPIEKSEENPTEISTDSAKIATPAAVLTPIKTQ